MNAAPDVRADSIAAFVSELTGDAEAPLVLLDAALGVEPEQLEPLRARDPRATSALAPAEAAARVDRLTALGVLAAAEVAAGSLDGRSIAIEGISGGVGLELAALAAERGASLLALSTRAGSVTGDIDTATLSQGWAESGPSVVEALGTVDDANAVLAAEVDVLFAGSRIGVIGHEQAPAVSARILVPHSPLPVTARAMAMLGRADTVVVPDFVSTGGPVFGWWPNGGTDDSTVDAAASAGVGAVTAEILGHDEGPFLGACYRAEAYLATWCEELPFGRPLAS